MLDFEFKSTSDLVESIKSAIERYKSDKNFSDEDILKRSQDPNPLVFRNDFTKFPGEYVYSH